MEKQKFHPYYIIMPVMAFFMMFFGTLTSGGFSVLVAGVRAQYEYAGTTTSLIFTIKNVVAFLVTFVAVKYYDKLGLRGGISLAFLLAAVAMMVCSFAGPNLAYYYGGGIILGASYALTMILPMALIVRRWFNKQRAFVLAIVASSTGFSGMIMTPLQQSWITNFGVSTAFRFEAIVFAVYGVLFFLIARSDPADLGVEPYGGLNYVEEVKDAKKVKSLPPATKTYTTAALAFMACAFITGFSSPPSQQHMLLHFAEIGYDPALSAAAYASFSGVLLASKLAVGVLSTRMKFKHVSQFFLAFYVITMGSLFVAGLVGVITWLPFFICVCFGIAGAINTLGYPNWLADFTTREDYETRTKNAQLGYQGGEMIGSLIPGIILDVTGSYTPWYLITALLYCVSFFCVTKFYGQRERELAAEATA